MAQPGPSPSPIQSYSHQDKRMRRTRVFVLAAAALCITVTSNVSAWSGHTLGTWQALAAMPELATAQVVAEPLEVFLKAQAPRMADVLNMHESWARESLPGYAPRPDALAFRLVADEDPAALRARWLRAMRVSPSVKLPLFLQIKPGPAETTEAADLPWQQVSTLPSGAGARPHRFRAVAVGEKLKALDVVASASNEPDYGLDIGLWDDNHGATTTGYHFGRQPFGNAAMDNSSQAPFHMGFFHESPIIFAAAAFLKRSYAEHRIHQFQALARQAFASGHSYWGWRFTGWALHYVQDLTQPYHASALPGVGVLRMLGVNVLDMAGASSFKNNAITLVSNRHAVVENYAYGRMRKAYETSDATEPLFAALRDTRTDNQHERYTSESTRKVVTAESNAAAAALDRQLELTFPAKYTSDPSQSLGQASDQLDMFAVAQEGPQVEHKELLRQLTVLMQNFGRHSRALVRSVLAAP